MLIIDKYILQKCQNFDNLFQWYKTFQVKNLQFQVLFPVNLMLAIRPWFVESECFDKQIVINAIMPEKGGKG